MMDVLASSMDMFALGNSAWSVDGILNGAANSGKSWVVGFATVLGIGLFFVGAVFLFKLITSEQGRVKNGVLALCAFGVGALLIGINFDMFNKIGGGMESSIKKVGGE